MLQKEAVEPRTLQLLEAIQADSMFAEFHLAGGTGLALQLGHRLSIDLDLFSTKAFDNNLILEHLEKEYQFILDYRAINTLKGSIRNIKVDFITHGYDLIEPTVNTEKIRLYSLADIAAMKINTITGNGTRSKDFVDLYFLLFKYSVGQMLKFYQNKYNDRNTFHAFKSLNYFDEVDMSDWPTLINNKNLSWEKVKAEINKQCEEHLKTI